MAKTVEIVMRAKGFYRQTINEEFIGDMSTHLREAAQSIPSTVNMVGKISPDYPYHAHLQFKSTHLLAYTRLTELKLNTIWRFIGDKLDKVFPCFYKHEPNDFGASYTWPLPYNMALWFVGMWDGPVRPGLKDPITGEPIPPYSFQCLVGGRLIKAYLLAIKGKAGGLLRLPLCNLYEDAAICMGTENTLPQEIHTGPVLDRLRAAINHFQTSAWNHHLRESITIDGAKSIFVLDPKGKPIKGEPPENWEKFCRKVNNTNYSDLGLHDLTQAGL